MIEILIHTWFFLQHEKRCNGAIIQSSDKSSLTLNQTQPVYEIWIQYANVSKYTTWKSFLYVLGVQFKMLEAYNYWSE